MCLAIPGKIIEIASDNPNSALVDVVGMRRRVDLGLLEDDRPVPGDWVLIHVGIRHEQNQRSGCSRSDANTGNAWARAKRRSKKCADTDWKKSRISSRRRPLFRG